MEGSLRFSIPHGRSMQRAGAAPSNPELPGHHAAGERLLLTFDRVTKFYGPVIGVNDISCRIGPGITGLLGANGAGKSTLIKLASGQLRPSARQQCASADTTPGARPPSTTWATAPTYRASTRR